MSVRQVCIECRGTGYAGAPPGFTFGADCPVCKGNGWVILPKLLPQMVEDAGSPPREDGGFLAEDFAFTATLLRRYSQPDDPNVRAPHRNSSLFRAVCSNNLNIILAALDAAAGRP